MITLRRPFFGKFLCQGRLFKYSKSLVLLLCACSVWAGTERPEPVDWRFDRLDLIGGHGVRVEGDPQRVATERGTAIEFDGDGDRLQIAANPVSAALEFTLEIEVKPLPAGPGNREPRLIHIEDPADSSHRITVEMRLTDDGNWYMDAFLLANGRGLPLIDPTLTHPLGQWTTLAISYGDGHFRSYVNGRPELEGSIDFMPLGTAAQTSVGARMNQVHYFRGLVSRLRATPRLLSPEELLRPNE